MYKRKSTKARGEAESSPNCERLQRELLNAKGQIFNLIWNTTLYREALQEIASKGCSLRFEGNCGTCAPCIAAKVLRIQEPNQDTTSQQQTSDITHERLIGPHDVFDGTLRSEGDVRVQGTMRGFIECEGDVLIDDGATVFADVASHNIIVAGRYHGLIRCSGWLHVSLGGYATGEIFARTLLVEEGGRIEGRVRTVDLKLLPPSDPDRLRFESRHVMNEDPRFVELMGNSIPVNALH